MIGHLITKIIQIKKNIFLSINETPCISEMKRFGTYVYIGLFTNILAQDNQP